MRETKKIIMKIVRIIYKIMYPLIPSSKKTILFLSFMGRGYSDSPKAIHQYLASHPDYKDYHFVWAIKKGKRSLFEIENAKVVTYGRFQYLYYLIRAKYWVVNCKLPAYVKKKDSQVYIQTWHGTPLKRLGHDIIVPEGTLFYRSQMTFEQMTRSYDIDVARYSYMVSPSSYTTKVFQTSFRVGEDKLIETGYPRNDILSTFSDKQADELKKSLNLPKDKKVILYAPTWRDNDISNKGFEFSLEVDFKKWQEQLQDEYIILFKPHYLIVTKFDLAQFEGFVYPINPSMDISELYIISDVLVTDYSSVFFDYAILKRPIYFYMYDLEMYESQLRGFYIDIYKDLPGKIYKEEDTLLTAIRNQEFDDSKMDEFCEYYTSFEDGNACKRVVEIMFNGKNEA